MSIADVFAESDQVYRNALMVDTWGHLMAEPGVYERTIRLACGPYHSNETIILDDAGEGFHSSPWWYERLQRFIDDTSKIIDCGQVVEFRVLVTVVEEVEQKPDDWDDWCDEDKEYWEPNVRRYFDINVQSTKVLVDAL